MLSDHLIASPLTTGASGGTPCVGRIDGGVEGTEPFLGQWAGNSVGDLHRRRRRRCSHRAVSWLGIPIDGFVNAFGGYSRD